MGILFTCWLFLLGAEAPEPTSTEGTSTRDALFRAMSLRLTFPSSLRANKPVRVGHCRKAAGGCDARLEEFARYFVLAGHEFGVDPWILAAMAFRESGYNPYAVGSAGELGLLQIHPRNRHARSLEWHRDPKHRERCQSEPGACQFEIVKAAASMLSNAIESCGSLESGLAAYQSGTCKRESSYSARVLATRRHLLELGCPGTSPLVQDAQAMDVPPACTNTKDNA